MQFPASDLDNLQSHYLQHLRDTVKETPDKTLTVSHSVTAFASAPLSQVHKDHAFAENPMEREDEQVSVKIEGEELEGLKEVSESFDLL